MLKLMGLHPFVWFKKCNTFFPQFCIIFPPFLRGLWIASMDSREDEESSQLFYFFSCWLYWNSRRVVLRSPSSTNKGMARTGISVHAKHKTKYYFSVNSLFIISKLYKKLLLSTYNFILTKKIRLCLLFWICGGNLLCLFCTANKTLSWRLWNDPKGFLAEQSYASTLWPPKIVAYRNSCSTCKARCENMGFVWTLKWFAAAKGLKNEFGECWCTSDWTMERCPCPFAFRNWRSRFSKLVKAHDGPWCGWG